MKPNQEISCGDFPCQDVDKSAYRVPGIDLDPLQIRLLVISESAPASPAENYYTGPHASFEQTSLQAFCEAGVRADSLLDLLSLGVYFTTAIKCAKTVYGIQTATVKTCSHLLETEINLFPNLKAYLLMGDVAIKGLNAIALRLGQGRVVPAGSTYKIRSGEFYYRGRRVFPSYLQVGPSFGIEKSKRRMIAEDIASAFALL